MPDEPKPPQILAAVAADFAVARWRAEEAAALVIADGFDADPARGGELSDGQRLRCLTLYHGTDAIW